MKNLSIGTKYGGFKFLLKVPFFSESEIRFSNLPIRIYVGESKLLLDYLIDHIDSFLKLLHLQKFG